MFALVKNALPNALTLANLACGIMSLMMIFQMNYIGAAFFILLACLADRYD